MKTLPVGVYAVTNLRFENLIPFKGECYQGRYGINLFSSLEDLVKVPLVPVEEPFLGYEGVSVVLIPSGVIKVGEIGKTNAERFRVVFRSPVAILGENMGLDANHHEDVELVNDRRAKESIIQGSFYFGAIAMTGETDGSLILDGLTLDCRVQDLRTGGKNARLEVRNCILTANIPANNIHVADNFVGERYTLIEYCRAAKLLSMNSESSIFYVGSGDGLISECFVGYTDKLIGMSNRNCTLPAHFRDLTIRFLWVEDYTGDRCLSFCMPDDGQRLTLFELTYTNSTRADQPPYRFRREGDNFVMITRNMFYGEVAECIATTDSNLKNLWSERNSRKGLGFFDEHEGAFQVTPPRRSWLRPYSSVACTDPHDAVEKPNFKSLDRLYAGRTCMYGDFHCHSDSGGTSDGKTKLADYVPAMDKLGMDFAAIVDHRQMRHFFLPEWDRERLICGTEPGCVLDRRMRPQYACKMDYTMIFPNKKGLADVLRDFPQFKFTGGKDGTYIYPNHSPEMLQLLGEYVYEHGGLLSHAHPKQLMVSDDPLDYYFGDKVAIETIHGSAASYATELNHKLWVDLLNRGKRVRTHGSSDSHGPVSNRGLTTVYSKKRFSTNIFKLVRAGDCTAGAVGIRMCIGKTPMGGVVDYEKGQTLSVKVGDFHRDHRPADTVYSLRIYTNRGLAWYKEFTGEDMAVALPVQRRRYYRVEVWNESDGHVVALSNPIWLNA